ncbi:hypothetical protein HDU86_006190 [Geranomyces michiganensis]|nr:hypothetical protein HDU86_006190 [Geranomyces michiganensis]
MGLSKWCACFGKGNAVDTDATEKLVTSSPMKDFRQLAFGRDNEMNREEGSFWFLHFYFVGAESRPKSSTITPIHHAEEHGLGSSGGAPSKAEIKTEKSFVATGGPPPPITVNVDTPSGQKNAAATSSIRAATSASSAQPSPATKSKPGDELIPSSTPIPSSTKAAKTRSSTAGSASSASSSALENKHNKGDDEDDSDDEEDEGPPKPIAAFGGDDGTAAVGVRGLLNRSKIKKAGGGGGKSSVVEMDIRNGDDDEHGRDGAGSGGGGVDGAGSDLISHAEVEPRRLNPRLVPREREESSHVMDAHPFQLQEDDDIP